LNKRLDSYFKRSLGAIARCLKTGWSFAGVEGLQLMVTATRQLLGDRKTSPEYQKGDQTIAPVFY
jgi:hypothetical protein